MFNYLPAGKSFNAFLIIFVSFPLFSSCLAPRTISGEDLLIEMQKTPCYGFCPVYTLKIAKNGKGLFEGVENVEKTGLFSFSLSPEELKELQNAFQSTGFYGLKNIYAEEISDLPTTYLTYIKDGRRKKIMDYYGAPEKLRELENRIEKLVLSKKMKKLR
jgi:hypothetical protein